MRPVCLVYFWKLSSISVPSKFSKLKKEYRHLKKGQQRRKLTVVLGKKKSQPLQQQQYKSDSSISPLLKSDPTATQTHNTMTFLLWMTLYAGSDESILCGQWPDLQMQPNMTFPISLSLEILSCPYFHTIHLPDLPWSYFASILHSRGEEGGGEEGEKLTVQILCLPLFYPFNLYQRIQLSSVLNWELPAPQDTFGNVWRHFWL